MREADARQVAEIVDETTQIFWELRVQGASIRRRVRAAIGGVIVGVVGVLGVVGVVGEAGQEWRLRGDVDVRDNWEPHGGRRREQSAASGVQSSRVRNRTNSKPSPKVAKALKMKARVVKVFGRRSVEVARGLCLVGRHSFSGRTAHGTAMVATLTHPPVAGTTEGMLALEGANGKIDFGARPLRVGFKADGAFLSHARLIESSLVHSS